MHYNDIKHRDIRPKNILLKSSEYTLKLEGPGNEGSLYYMPPELFNKENEFDERVDIWSLGCVIFQLCGIKNSIPFGRCIENL